MPRTTFPILLAAAILLAGCADEGHPAPDAEPAPVAPTTEALRLPANPQARADAAVAALLEEREIREVPAHRDALVDLDGDGTGEVLAYLDDPNWCTDAGCTLLVFQRKEDEGEELLAEIAPVQLPIRVANQTNSGWRDILVTVGGGTVPAGTVALYHDGIGYPEDPTLFAALAPDVLPDAEAAID